MSNENEESSIERLTKKWGTRDINSKMPKNISTSGGGASGWTSNLDYFYHWDVNTTLKYLSKLNYSEYIPEYYDCEDRAFWAMAHVRRRFPGSGIGIASGKALEGDLANEEHAILILWYAKEKDASGKITQVGYKYWDPVYSKDGPNEMDSFEVRSIVSFPLGRDIPPSNKESIGLLDNNALVFDNMRIMYPLENLLDYLNNPNNKSVYKGRKGKKISFWDDVGCIHPHNSEEHKQNSDNDMLLKWMDYDTTFSAFVHARRKFKGCALGMAIGDVIKGVHASALIIWHLENDEIKYGYWDPKNPTSGLTDSFVPRIIIA